MRIAGAPAMTPSKYSGIALGHQHRFATAGGAAGEVRMVRRLPVVLRDDALRDLRDATDGHVSEIEIRLLVLHEAAVERAGPLMAGVGADDGEAARERGAVAGGRGAEGRCTDPLSPPPPWNRNRPFQSSGSASAKPMP